MIYFLIKTILKFYFFLVLNIFVRGMDFIPEKGAAIIVANHPGFMDGPLMVTVMKRRIHTFAKAKVFNSIFKMWFLKVVGGIPVGSEKTNKNALIETEKLLDANKLLLIFPEGKTNAEPDLLPFKSGFLKLAAKFNVPVIPIAIMGGEKSLRPGQFFPSPADVYVSFLEPLHFNISDEKSDGLINKKELQYHVEKVRNIIQQKLNVMKNTYGT